LTLQQPILEPGPHDEDASGEGGGDWRPERADWRRRPGQAIEPAGRKIRASRAIGSPTAQEIA
jgi:hypothetical protein